MAKILGALADVLNHRIAEIASPKASRKYQKGRKLMIRAKLSRNSKKVLRNQEGITLIELMVAMLLLGLFLITVSIIVPTIMRQFTYSNSLSELNSLMNNVAIEVSNDMLMATRAIDTDNTEITVNGETISTDKITIHTNAGSITYATPVTEDDWGADSVGLLLRAHSNTGDTFSPVVFPRAYYRNKSVRIECEEISAGLFKLTVYVQDQNYRTTLSREYYVRPLGL